MRYWRWWRGSLATCCIAHKHCLKLPKMWVKVSRLCCYLDQLGKLHGKRHIKLDNKHYEVDKNYVDSKAIY